VLLAVRPGQEVLIPESYRAQFARAGWSFCSPPEDVVVVTEPTPLAAVPRRAESVAVVAPVSKKKKKSEG